MIPKELQFKYFFKDMNSCPLKEAFQNNEFVWEALRRKNSLIHLEKEDVRGNISENVVIKKPVVIGENTTVDPFVVIKGPVIIGKNCAVRSGALIRSFTIIGNNCVVGHNAEIKNSIIFDYVKISTNSFVGDSIIGKGGRTGSGVITGNRRFDQKPVSIKLNELTYETKFEKFGCVIGDYSRLGANAVTAPGTLIGPFTWIYGVSSVRGFIKGEEMVKLRQKFEKIDKGKQVLNFKDREGKI